MIEEPTTPTGEAPAPTEQGLKGGRRPSSCSARLAYPALAAAMIVQSETDAATAERLRCPEWGNAEKAARYQTRADALRATAKLVWPNTPDNPPP